MAEKTEVKSIVIQYADGQTKELSVEDAKALHRQLDELFGEVPACAPVVIERTRWPYWWPPYSTPVTWKSYTTTQRPLDCTPTVYCKTE